MDGEERAASAPRSDEGLGRKSYEHWALFAIAVAGVGLLIAFTLWIEPDPRGYGTHEKLGLPACKMLELTGWPCPGCGVTTSVALAARGRLVASFLNQPFGLVVALAMPLYAVWACVGVVRGRDLYRELVRVRLGRWGVMLVVLLVASWIYKAALLRGWIAVPRA